MDLVETKQWFARDSMLWQCFFYLGLIATALTSVADPAAMGIPLWLMPYVRLVAFLAAVVGGKMGLSPVPLARNIQ
jgi:hypothetical protein